MGKLLAVWSCLLLLSLNLMGCGSLSPGDAKQPSSYIQKLGNETVALVYRIPNGQVHTFCSGVWVGNNAILTAHHCVTGAINQMTKDQVKGAPALKEIGLPIHFIQENENMGVEQEPSAIHLSQVSFIDEYHDLALLYVVGRAIPPHIVIELGDSSPAIGEKIHIVGHTIGLYWTHVDGTVSAYRDIIPNSPVEKLGPFMQVNASVYPGNSGGGCFDSHGRLVGIVSFIAPTPDTAFLIGLKSIQNFLHAHLHE